jgi:hypothetical protein
MHLIEPTGLSRGEIIYRGKDLEAQQLIQFMQMTDTAFTLHAAVAEALGIKHEEQFLELLQSAGSNAAEPLVCSQ